MNHDEDAITKYNRLRANPREVLAEKFNIPVNVDVSNPDGVLQYLLNTGQISQNDVNKLMMLRNDPAFIKRLFNN